MSGLITRWIINALALFLTAQLLPGQLVLEGFVPALVAAVLLGIVNACIRPFFVLITLPLNLLTLGAFTFVINALMLLLVAAVVEGFAIAGFWSGLLAALLLSVISSLLSALVRR